MATSSMETRCVMCVSFVSSLQYIVAVWRMIRKPFSLVRQNRRRYYKRTNVKEVLCVFYIP